MSIRNQNKENTLETIKKDSKETLRMVILINRSLQSFKQDVLLRFEKIDKLFDKNTEEHRELKELILKGDQALVKLLVRREREITDLQKKFKVLEERVQKLELRFV